MTDSEARPRLREPRQRVSPRARLMWATSAGLEAVVLVAILAVVGPITGWLPIPGWLVALVGVLAAAYVVVMPLWRYRVHRWEVTDTAVYTQTGWWVRERRIAPMSRIQTVDHAEGAIARLFGLATVTVTTASAAGALEIVGLERGRALELVDQLAVQADTVPGDAT
ncbi:PH domain-containing protein [Nocardioides sp. LMS-CY]|uniref:PH domain-containing protein n=1 Tax=Nocardioides sp. (strain LMS-CY) TaxID=2840457 RepID=UPI00207AFEAD|nr:PH domain-containing protein [Nocardioides sp. LMS-CY]